MDYPRLSTPVYLTLLALLCLILAWTQDRWADWLRFFLGCAGMLFLIVAIFSLWETFTFRANERLVEYQRAMAITENVAMLQALGKLNPEQLKAIDRYIPTVDLVAGDIGPLYILRLPMNQECPMTFVRDFLRSGDDDYLQPIRSYAEGSRQREYAQNLTSWMHFQGWCDEAAGNRPARWTNKARALRALGLTDANWEQET
jgi:hypothetical protein